MDPKIVQVQLQKPKAKGTPPPPKNFTFDGVYFIEDNTQQIYEEICFPLVSGVLEGYNGTVFAYGQTGCGKSYTMMGVEDPPENRGIIPRAFGHIFDQVAVNSSVKYLVRASYLEIYNEEVSLCELHALCSMILSCH
jgi:kinesin family protein 3/17